MPTPYAGHGGMNSYWNAGVFTVINADGNTIYTVDPINRTLAVPSGSTFAPAGSIGFYGATAVAQQATTGTTTGFTAGSGTASKSDSTHTGGSGSKAYTVSDVVLDLKNLGLMAAS